MYWAYLPTYPTADSSAPSGGVLPDDADSLAPCSYSHGSQRHSSVASGFASGRAHSSRRSSVVLRMRGVLPGEGLGPTSLVSRLCLT